MTILAPRTVLATAEDIRTLADNWPCSGMRFEDSRCVSFEFATNGDLVDIQWYDERGLDIPEAEGIDGRALLALSQDAQIHLI
jgi:hypothetical protein